MKVTSVKKLNHGSLIIIFSLVLLLAIVFLILSVCVLNQKIPENYVETQATIKKIDEFENIDNEIEYTVFIDYQFGSQNYENKEYGKHDTSMKIGDKVNIFVNPDSPDEFMTDNSDDFIFLLLSIVFIVIGLGGIIINVKQIVDEKRRKA